MSKWKAITAWTSPAGCALLGVALLWGYASAERARDEKAKLMEQNQQLRVALESAAGKERFFEMRTYTANEGKLEALHARFRDHTNRLFVKHGIDLVGYWTPTDKDGKEASKDTLVYILAYPSPEAREKSWAAFQNDPDWKKAKADSEKDGALVKQVDQKFMRPTDFSPMK